MIYALKRRHLLNFMVKFELLTSTLMFELCWLLKLKIEFSDVSCYRNLWKFVRLIHAHKRRCLLKIIVKFALLIFTIIFQLCWNVKFEMEFSENFRYRKFQKFFILIHAPKTRCILNFIVNFALLILTCSSCVGYQNLNWILRRFPL